MSLVVDASVACKWVFEENGSPQARMLLGGGERLIAPDLILAEMAKVVWRRVISGEINDSHAEAVSDALPQLFDDIVPLTGLAARALAISLKLRHPAYDCFYLALAEQRSALLVSDDRRLLNAAAGTTWAQHVQPLQPS